MQRVGRRSERIVDIRRFRFPDAMLLCGWEIQN
jgi:hypothetical protein